MRNPVFESKFDSGVQTLRMTYNKALSVSIKTLVMEVYELVQGDLAPVLGVSRATTGRKLSGEVTWTAEEVGLTAELFGVSPADLMPTSDPHRGWVPAPIPDKGKAPTEVRASLEEYAIRDSNPGPTD